MRKNFQNTSGYIKTAWVAKVTDCEKIFLQIKQIFSCFENRLRIKSVFLSR